MTTIAQVRTALSPLLERNSNLALVGRRIVLKPVRHILRFIMIDRSLDPQIFAPKWSALFLFERQDRFDATWGDRLFNYAHGQFTTANPATSNAMCREIEEIALPKLETLQTIDGLVAFTTSDLFYRKLDGYPSSRAIVDSARGDLAAAQKICEFLQRDIERGGFHSQQLASEYLRLPPLVAAGDRAGIASLLHEWERYTVGKLKLDKFWEPTPFPIEEQMARGA